jgi:hypothetical protein
LQEVVFSDFHEQLAPELAKDGYEGVLQVHKVRPRKEELAAGMRSERDKKGRRDAERESGCGERESATRRLEKG